MFEKTTDELMNQLKSADVSRPEEFLKKHSSEMFDEQNPFASYMRSLFQKHKIKQQDVFLKADFSQRYGYRLISGERRTKQRDYILRLCLGAEFTLDETQRALQIYGMSRLYIRIPRDAVLIMCIEQGIYDIFKINQQLAEHQMPMLKASTMDD